MVDMELGIREEASLVSDKPMLKNVAIRARERMSWAP
jgi:hypothetical protein